MSQRCHATQALLLLLVTAGLVSAADQVFRYDGPGSGLDYANDVKVGPNGDIYVAGGSTGDGTGLDFTVLCVTPTCSLRWAYRWNHTASSADVARALAVGPDGNIYACGFTANPVPYYDVVVASLTPDGEERWVSIRQGQWGGEDSASSIAIDEDGNIYTAGVGDEIEGSNTEFVVLSFEPDSGGLRWVYATTAAYVDEATDVTVGPDSTVIAVGRLWNGSGPSVLTVAAINSANGEERWRTDYGRGDNGSQGDAVVWADGRVFASGYSGSNNWDFTVIALDDDSGSLAWDWHYTNTDQYADRAWDIIADTDGNTYSCGRTMDSSSTQRFTVAGISPSGIERWLYRMPGGSPGHQEQANEIVQRSDGYLYACGWTDSVWDYRGDVALVVCLDTSGAQQWSYRYDPVPESVDVASAIALGPDDRVYSCGWSWGEGTGLDMFLLSLDRNPGVAERTEGVSRRPGVGLLGATIVRGVLVYRPTARGSRPAAALQDAAGRKVMDLLPGANDVSRLNPGVFFVTGEGLGTRKVIITD